MFIYFSNDFFKNIKHFEKVNLKTTDEDWPWVKWQLFCFVKIVFDLFEQFNCEEIKKIFLSKSFKVRCCFYFIVLDATHNKVIKILSLIVPNYEMLWIKFTKICKFCASKMGKNNFKLNSYSFVTSLKNAPFKRIFVIHNKIETQIVHTYEKKVRYPYWMILMVENWIIAGLRERLKFAKSETE